MIPVVLHGEIVREPDLNASMYMVGRPDDLAFDPLFMSITFCNLAVRGGSSRILLSGHFNVRTPLDFDQFDENCNNVFVGPDHSTETPLHFILGARGALRTRCEAVIRELINDTWCQRTYSNLTNEAACVATGWRRDRVLGIERTSEFNVDLEPGFIERERYDKRNEVSRAS